MVFSEIIEKCKYLLEKHLRLFENTLQKETVLSFQTRNVTVAVCQLGIVVKLSTCNIHFNSPASWLENITVLLGRRDMLCPRKLMCPLDL